MEPHLAVSQNLVPVLEELRRLGDHIAAEQHLRGGEAVGGDHAGGVGGSGGAQQGGGEGNSGEELAGHGNSP